MAVSSKQQMGRDNRDCMDISQCGQCGRGYVAAPAFCRCGSQEFHAKQVPGTGRVYSCTTLHAAAEAFEKDLPFQIAIIDLDGGARLTGRITGARVDIGDTVKHSATKDGVHFFKAA